MEIRERENTKQDRGTYLSDIYVFVIEDHTTGSSTKQNKTRESMKEKQNEIKQGNQLFRYILFARKDDTTKATSNEKGIQLLQYILACKRNEKSKTTARNETQAGTIKSSHTIIYITVGLINIRTNVNMIRCKNDSPALMDEPADRQKYLH